MSLGFREEEDGSLLLPLDANLLELEARRLELTVGLELNKKRAARIRDTINSNQAGPPGPDKALRNSSTKSQSASTSGKATATASRKAAQNEGAIEGSAIKYKFLVIE